MDLKGRNVEIFLIGGVCALVLFSVILYKKQQALNVCYQKIEKLNLDYAILNERYTQSLAMQESLKENENALEERIRQFLNQTTQEALLKNQSAFLDLAKNTLNDVHQKQKADLDSRQVAIHHLIDPVQKALGAVDTKLKELEKERQTAYLDIKHQVQHLIEAQKDLRFETANLVKALRTPMGRGQWGEIQLKRVVELAGMLEHCDFVQQQTGDDKKLRPDMVIRLPGKKHIVVDAKTPLSAYLNAIEAKLDHERQEFLAEHSVHVRTHIKNLSQKSYWEQFEDSPEFVIMFIPSESLFSAALEKDPSLIEFGAQERVIIATPTTLIALLRAIAYGWRQESIHDNIKQVIYLGQELYKRFNTFGTYFSKIGRHLNQSVDVYNQTLSSLENRLLPVVRRLQDVKSLKTDETPPTLQAIDSHSKTPHAPELSHEE
ncbi:MAG: hypothetical protein CNLJKLNK_00749 [Holosporales bacterium]